MQMHQRGFSGLTSDRDHNTDRGGEVVHGGIVFPDDTNLDLGSSLSLLGEALPSLVAPVQPELELALPLSASRCEPAGHYLLNRWRGARNHCRSRWRHNSL